MSSRSIDVTPTVLSEPETESAPIRTQTPPPQVPSLPVVQQPFCQSPADPARCRSAVPPGYQVVRSSFALRAPSKSAHQRRSRSSLKCCRCCCTYTELERCLPFPTTDRRPKGAATSDVKRGKLSGHPALFDERT